MELNLGFLQAEGITFINDNQYLISSEKFTNNNPMITSESRLFSFDTTDEKIKEPLPKENKQGLLIFKRFGARELEYEINGEILGRAIFDSHGRRIKYMLGKDIAGNIVNLSTLNSAIYYLAFYTDNGIVSAPFWMN